MPCIVVQPSRRIASENDVLTYSHYRLFALRDAVESRARASTSTPGERYPRRSSPLALLWRRPQQRCISARCCFCSSNACLLWPPNLLSHLACFFFFFKADLSSQLPRYAGAAHLHSSTSSCCWRHCHHHVGPAATAALSPPDLSGGGGAATHRAALLRHCFSHVCTFALGTTAALIPAATAGAAAAGAASDSEPRRCRCSSI